MVCCVVAPAENATRMDREIDRLSSRVLAGNGPVSGTRRLKTRWTDSAVSTYALAPINISAHLRVTRKYEGGCGTKFCRSRCALIHQAARSSHCGCPCTKDRHPVQMFRDGAARG